MIKPLISRDAGARCLTRLNLRSGYTASPCPFYSTQITWLPLIHQGGLQNMNNKFIYHEHRKGVGSDHFIPDFATRSNVDGFMSSAWFSFRWLFSQSSDDLPDPPGSDRQIHALDEECFFKSFTSFPSHRKHFDTYQKVSVRFITLFSMACILRLFPNRGLLNLLQSFRRGS